MRCCRMANACALASAAKSSSSFAAVSCIADGDDDDDGDEDDLGEDEKPEPKGIQAELSSPRRSSLWPSLKETASPTGNRITSAEFCVYGWLWFVCACPLHVRLPQLKLGQGGQDGHQ